MMKETKKMRCRDEDLSMATMKKKRKKKIDMEELRRSAVLPIPSPSRVLSQKIGSPNWGDEPSPEARHLVDIALRGYHDEQARFMFKSVDSFAWTLFDFGGALHINSSVDSAIWIHMNFKGKIKVQSPDSAIRGTEGPYLFFAELRKEHGQPDYSFVSCENLGVYSSVYKPTLRGCMGCNREPHRTVVMHGKRSFSVGPTVELIGQYPKRVR